MEKYLLLSWVRIKMTVTAVIHMIVLLACPYNLKPYAFDNKNSMDDCTLCMDCSSACDSVAFRITKPSRHLFEKFKFNKAEVWALILITAAITITMNFHHALSRTAIADTFIWSTSAAYVQQYVDFGSI